MNWHRWLLVTLIAVLPLVGLPLAPAPAEAVLTFEFNTEFSGASTPSGTAPWLTATFSDAGVGVVTLSLVSDLEASSEFFSEVSFNLDPAFNPTILSVLNTGGTAPTSIQTGTDAFKADGDGFFDLLFAFPTAGGPGNLRFDNSDTSTYTITCAGCVGFNADSFNFLSVNPGGAGPQFAAAHVQGIGEGGENSGWIAPSPVPEPGTLLLLASGLIGAGAGSRRFRRRG